MKVKRIDKCDRLTTEVVAVIADDDYVTVLMPRKYPGSAHSRQGVRHDVVRYLAVRQRQGRRALGSGHDCPAGRARRTLIGGSASNVTRVKEP